MDTPCSSASTPRSRAAIFDLGKVLLDFDYQIAATALGAHSRMSPDEFRDVIDHSPLLYRLESGRLTTAEFEEEIRRHTGYSASSGHFQTSFADIFTEISEMIALKEELRARGIPTYIFSNTNEIAVEHIRRRHPFFHGFDGLVLSYEIGAMKPEPAAYAAVEAMTGLQGADLVYLDDRAENIAGAAARGWNAILHETPATSRKRVEELIFRSH